MTLSLISFSVQVLYGYLIRNFIFLLCDPHFRAQTWRSCGKMFMIFFIIINPIIILCIVLRGRHKKSLNYGVNESLFQVLFFMKFNKLLSSFLRFVLLLLRQGEHFFSIYWVNLCLPAQWLRIPLCYRYINYGYRKHHFLHAFISRFNKKETRKNVLAPFHVQCAKGFEKSRTLARNHEC